VDAGDNPVAGAKVGFNNDNRPTPLGARESHQFGWIEVVTDERGRWTMNRLADDIIGSIYGYASHAEHLDSPLVFSSRDRAAEQAMRKGSYKFELGTGVVAEGRVVDSSGRSLPYANILVGHVDMSGRREGIASADGSFSIRGCPPGDTAVTASLPGFAASTVKATLGENSKPVVLTLAPAKTLRLRVVDGEGNPVSGAIVWLDTIPKPINDPDAPMPQVDFSPKTDADGRVTWNEAPDRELRFDIFKPGFMRLSAINLRPGDQEYLITMLSGLTVSGTVADAVTGKPIPKFRVHSGWPEAPLPGREPGFRWSPFDRDAMDFSNGTFRHVYDEPMVTGLPNPGYGFKFMADGYAPFVSRVIPPDETEVILEVKLQPTAGTIVTVVSADGRPIAGADYAKTTERSLFRVVNRRIVAEFGSTVERTDASGQIRLAADPELTGLMIANDEGFVALQREQITGEFSVNLQPWGSIFGTLVDENGLPLTGVELDVQPMTTPGARFPAQITVTTDAEGHFTFASVPPGKIAIVEKVSVDNGSGQLGWSSRTLGTVIVAPGQTATATVVRAEISTANDHE
jgi:protocatechuate 3,4-dioxygenase beta subunit